MTIRAAWLVLIFSACGGGAAATRVHGTFAGAAWSSDDARVVRTGAEIVVSVGTPSVTAVPTGRFVVIELDAARCAGAPGRIALPDPSARISWHDETTRATGEALGGHVDLLQCGSDWLRLGFVARFLEGEVSGSVTVTIPEAGVAGQLGGAAWSSVTVDGVFCDRCGGGPTLSVVAQGAGLSFGVQLDGGRCGAGRWAETLGGDGDDARVWYGPPQGPTTDAVEGTIEIERCARDHVAVRVLARFADGSEVAGRLVTSFDTSFGAPP